MLKNNHKKYIQDFLAVKKMISYSATVFPIKAGLFISIDQAGNNKNTNLAAYQ